MAKHTVTGATMRCSMGSAPAALVATPKRIRSGGADAANVLDHRPLANIPPFGRCRSLAFPPTAAATAAASGRLTPMPCLPNTPAPWVAGSPTVIAAGAPALDDGSRLFCVWAGTIRFLRPGQTTESIP